MTGFDTRVVTRRGFLGLAGAATAVGLAACSGLSGSSGNPGPSGGGGGGVIKFWDMPWGATSYNDAAKVITDGYAPPSNLPKASYQLIQWNNFYQTFASAIASNTGPAVSTGGGFQPFQFAEQGAIAYADNLINGAWTTDGTKDDFLPGLLDAVKTTEGYAGIPWQLDARIIWHNKALLDKAGVAEPTDWDSFRKAGQALKKIGVYGFAIGAGAGNFLGTHAMVALMIMNGGGVFNPDGKPDLVTERNIEAMDYLRSLVSDGIVDPASVSYTTDNLNSQWNSGKAGMGYNSAALPNSAGKVAADLEVNTPLTGPHGDKKGLHFVNCVMMYKNTPSQEGSEAFVQYYYKAFKEYWVKNLVGGVPVLKSIAALPEFKANKNMVKIVTEYSPISTTYAATGTKAFAGLAALDGGQAISQFAQTMLAGKTDSKQALTTFQSGLEAALKQ